MTSPFAKIPSVNDLLDNLKDQSEVIDQKYLKIIIDDIISEIKANPRKSGIEKKDRSGLTNDILDEVKKRIDQVSSPPLRHVINATGVILHTGLGRAPMARETVEANKQISGYTNLEIQLKNGRRGQRLDHVVPILRLLTGSEDAVVVNNNAAAVLLMLNTISRRKEVIVSRGELVEIGGSFRMPEVMKTSGAKMVEVGATNKTHLSDYEEAINNKTAAIMLVHPSNYEIMGFTAKPELKEIIELGHKYNVPVMYDLGSGALIDMQRFGFEYEPVVEDMVKMGFDLISFSGDKLLGGPQAGIIVGKLKWIKKIKQNHLLRALRCDKITLGTMAGVLREYLHSGNVTERNPTLRLFGRDLSFQEELINNLISSVSRSESIELKKVSTTGKVGSGAYPIAKIPALALKITVKNLTAEKISRHFRLQDVPVFGYIENDEYYLSMLTVFPEDIATLAEIINKM